MARTSKHVRLSSRRRPQWNDQSVMPRVDLQHMCTLFDCCFSHVLLLRLEEGDWLTENEMRDEKHFDEERIKAVVRFCMKNHKSKESGGPELYKWDKYQRSVLKYFVQTDKASIRRPVYSCVWIHVCDMLKLMLPRFKWCSKKESEFQMVFPRFKWCFKWCSNGCIVSNFLLVIRICFVFANHLGRSWMRLS